MSRARLNNDYHDVIVVGAGFGGMYALHKFRDHLGLKVKVLEQGDGVGGTWYWNRYPGAHCDVPVLEYQYSFNKELAEEYSPKFKTVMAAQPYGTQSQENWRLPRSLLNAWHGSPLCSSAEGVWLATSWFREQNF